VVHYSKSLVLQSCVLYNVHTFLHQIWRDKIWCFLLKKLDCFTSTE